MQDVNAIAAKLLEPMKAKAKLVYAYPENFNSSPIISYYELSNNSGFRADNAEQSQIARVQIDIWSAKKAEPGSLAIAVNEVMQADGWIRELSRDLPKGSDDKYYHKTMRYKKEIF